MQTLIITHANCVDGFISQYLLSLINPNPITVYYSYNTSLIDKIKENKDIKDISKIIVCDLGLDLEQLGSLQFLCSDVQVFDHHETTARLYGSYCVECIGLSGHTKPVSVLLEENVCASKIILKKYAKEILNYFLKKSEHLDKEKENKGFNYFNYLFSIVTRVDDYDLWTLEYEDTFILNQIVRTILELPKDEFSNDLKNELLTDFVLNYENYFETDIVFQTDGSFTYKGDKDFIRKAVSSVNERNIIVKHYCSKAKFVNIKDKQIPFVQCPSDYVNYVGHTLYENNPYVFMYWIDPVKNTIKLSLRSHPKFGDQVNKVLEPFGGGGHKSAAGCLLSLNDNTIKSIITKLNS
jgi:oligoribonuclease NrnB/cAMP/cGMP phosphodiesterase (DHH superfamily)